jgi:hypothetical protein
MTNKIYFKVAKSILRVGACYGLWTTGDMTLQAVGIFFAVAEFIEIGEYLG